MLSKTLNSPPKIGGVPSKRGRWYDYLQKKYPLRLKLLYEAKAKGLQAALLWEPKGSFVADRCFFRIGVATNAIIPRWPPNLGGQSLKGILY